MRPLTITLVLAVAALASSEVVADIVSLFPIPEPASSIIACSATGAFLVSLSALLILRLRTHPGARL